MKPRRFALFGGDFLVFQLRSQPEQFFILRLRRTVVLHTERAGVHSKREQGNDEGAKANDIPKHLFFPNLSVVVCKDMKCITNVLRYKFFRPTLSFIYLLSVVKPKAV